VLNKNTQFYRIRLVILPGSINWLINRETGNVEEKEYNLTTSGKIGLGFYDKEGVMYLVIGKNCI